MIGPTRNVRGLLGLWGDRYAARYRWSVCYGRGSDPGSAGLRRDLFGFRGKRADRIKLLWWDGQGSCLFYKILERGYFPWPTAKDGVVHLTQAQLSMLVEGIDWRRPA